jgi:hypothetical protein
VSDEPADFVRRGEDYVSLVAHPSGWHDGRDPGLWTVSAHIGLEAQVALPEVPQLSIVRGDLVRVSAMIERTLSLWVELLQIRHCGHDAILTDAAEARLAQRHERVLLEPGRRSIGPRSPPHDVVAALAQNGNGLRADQAGAANDHDLHGFPPLSTTGDPQTRIQVRRDLASTRPCGTRRSRANRDGKHGEPKQTRMSRDLFPREVLREPGLSAGVPNGSDATPT